MTNALTLSPTKYRPDLQGLRAIAIFLVVASHADIGPFVSGHIGVDVFFILSGFLISQSIIFEMSANNSFNYVNFIARRFKRLLPALICMIALTTTLAIILLSSIEASKQLASTPFASTYTSNLFFAFTNTQYFDELSKQDLFLHTWSLGIEEQFYLIWPALLLLPFLYCKVTNASASRRMQVLKLTIIIITVASLTLFIWLSNKHPELAFYLMPSRMWQFCAGALTFLYFCNDPQQNVISKATSYTLLAIGICLLLAAGVLLGNQYTNIYAWISLPTAGTVLLLIAGHNINQITNPMSNKVLVWIGDRSYSIYLWHMPILLLGFNFGLKGNIAAISGLILLTLITSMVSYKYIELPFWKGEHSKTPALTVIIASLITALGLAFILNSYIKATEQSITPQEIAKHLEIGVPRIYSDGCDEWYHSSTIRPCIYGTNEAKKTVVLLTDSIGAQWFSALPLVYPAPEWRIIVLTKSACAIVDENFYYERISRNYTECTTWRNSAIKYAQKLKPDVVMIGSSATYKFTAEQWQLGTQRVLKELTKHSKKTIVIMGTPGLGFDGPNCLVRPLAISSCTSQGKIEELTNVKNSLLSAVEIFPNAHLLDMNNIICPEDICKAKDKSNVTVFRDSQHLNDKFVRTHTPEIKKLILTLD